MKLSVVIPTYNREKLLAKTLQSLDNAQIPPNFEIEVIVCNNNSTDGTETIIENFKSRMTKIKLTSIFEEKQGRSAAVNAGIRKAEGDLVAMIDDDIQISENWFLEIERIFNSRWKEIDFIGGKVLPIWEAEPPKWVTEIKDVGICWRDYGEEEWKYSEQTPIVTGGHAVFKREIFDEIGLYSEELGVKKKNFISCEDDVMFEKLINAGKSGIYSPKLVVHHFVPTHRLNKNYFRQWNFGAGISWNLVDLYHKPFVGARILKVPRYMYRKAFSGIIAKFKSLFSRNEVESLRAEKDILLLLGFFYSRNIANSKLDNPLKKIVSRRIQVAER
ncbi:MAG: glycosyltransferase [Pyrinomonadaceae bacterium]|nr:glycosyltransferase [Pyrinomonadaceae bacterium]